MTDKLKEDQTFDKAANKYLMDNQDSTIKESVTELMGDWALDAFNAGWDAQQKRITELENHFRWLEFRLGSPAIEGYLRFVIKQVFPEGDGEYSNRCINCGLYFEGDKRDVSCKACKSEGGGDEI